MREIEIPLSKHLSQINETSRENVSSDISKLKDENISLLKDNLNPELYHRSLSDSQDNLININYNTSKKINISPKARSFVFFLFLLSNIFISMDHGSIPASTNELRLITTMDQTIGLFGSLVYVGNIFGSIIVFMYINKYNRKNLLLISLIFNSICLYTFVYFENIPFLFFNRIVVGIFQSYITIYLPVWCNQYGERDNKNMMIALVQFVSPIGIFFGYLIAAISINNDIGWKCAFIVQGTLILLLLIVFYIVPNKFFENNVYCVSNMQGEEMFIIKVDEDLNEYEDNIPLKKKLSLILNKKIFLYSVIALSSLIYVISGVQYWISDYMNQILLIKGQKERLFIFTLVCFTSPTLGVLIGTFTKDILCRNDRMKSLLFCLILGILATFFAISVTFTSNLYLYTIYMWFVLFFGGGIVPVITNLIINSVPKELDASGNSITNLFSNLFGYLPAPYIYGLLIDIFQDKGYIAMIFTMWYSCVGCFFIGLANYVCYMKIKEKEMKMKNKKV